MRRYTGRLSAVMLLCATPVVLGPQAAIAAVADCPDGHICIWNQADFGGQMSKTVKPTAACIPGVSRSAVNGSTDLRVLFWSDRTCSGEFAVLAPGHDTAAVTPVGGSVKVEVVDSCGMPAGLCLVGTPLAGLAP